MLDIEIDDLQNFAIRIEEALITIITITINLFLGFFRDYIVYIFSSSISNSLNQITANSYVIAILNMFQSAEGVGLLGSSVISALISLIPVIKFLKWLNEEWLNEEEALGQDLILINLILALLIEIITLFL
ncbi:MAG: hypothetical protein ACP5IE_05765 [Infirmifilum sp.]